MLPDALGVRLNIGGYACNLGLHSYVPVSYTHLDVYKRQVNTPTVVASAAGLDVPNKATATATANSKKFDAQIIPAGAVTVSYTHL